MSDKVYILGQLAAAATTEETLYVVPDSDFTSAVVSTLVICNRTTASKTFRVSVTEDGGALPGTATTNQDYIFYDTAIAANTTITVTIGMTLGQNDAVRTYASATGLSFNLFGVETKT